MSILALLIILIVLFFAWWFGRSLPAPWPVVIAVICVVICFAIVLGMMYPNLLTTPIHR